MQKHVNLVDLVKSFPTNIYLQKLASIQQRTSPIKFAHLAEKSGKGSISNLSTKAEPLVGLSMMECAAACDNHALKSDPDYCIGFNHYNVRDEDTLCYLLKSIDEIWKYNCEYGTR